MKEFIMIPKSLVCDHDLGDKRVLAYSSIFFSGWNGENLSDLVSYSKYSLNRGKGKVLQQFQLLVSQLINRNYFSPGMVYIKQPGRFCIVYYDEFQRIMKFREEKLLNQQRINHAQLILLLAYIRSNMIHKDGMPEFYSDLISRLSEQIKMSPRSISIALDMLQELHIIYNEKLPRYQDRSGGWHSNVTIFINMERRGETDYNWQNELERGKRLLSKSETIRRQLLN